MVSQGAGGSALVVDYGADHATGNSFRVRPLLLAYRRFLITCSLQAFKGHALANPFDCPGQADLTVNVDFAYLAEALKGTGTSLSPSNKIRCSSITATAHGPLSQRSFLHHMGLGTRISALQCAAATPERADVLSKAAARLVDPAGMGKEYKVMGVTAGTASAADTDGVWPFIAGEIQEQDPAASRAQHPPRDA